MSGVADLRHVVVEGAATALRVSDDRYLIAYNVLGSYALARAARDRRLAVVAPRDYTLILSRAAMMRFPLFIAVWAAAIWLLPAWTVAVAFAGWLAMVAPGIRFVNGRFQHVGPDEEPA